MKNPPVTSYLTGVAVPVAALRTEKSCGIGEFLDLVEFGNWCRACGLDLIQLLPINDTGEGTSPYSAQSAYALHPVYIRLSSVPGASAFEKEIGKIESEFEYRRRIDFGNVYRAKIGILKAIYETEKAKILDAKELKTWIGENSWVQTYAAYCLLKEKNENKSWTEWEGMKDPTPAEIERLWKDNREELVFYAWVQLHLENQLRQAVGTLNGMGIRLKGDLPILMSEDSADVWAHRELFVTQLRAGAPPDMFSDFGQNWGFPVYNWDRLEQTNFEWWRGRIRQADKFFHAIRIDHVLGFFRLWVVPEEDVTAVLGWFRPSLPVRHADLVAAGFTAGRIRWMSLPHIFEDDIRRRLGDKGLERVAPWLDRIGNERLYNFKPSIRGEKDIYALPLSIDDKEALLSWWRNRLLVQTGEVDDYHAAWQYTESQAYQNLEAAEKGKLELFFKDLNDRMEKDWEKKGLELLSFLKSSTEMMICAEDLGVVPPCVPKVLAKLGFLSLRISRWSRDYKKTPAPFIPPEKFPFLSVCTPGVHDTTTIRGWWETEEYDKELLLKAYGFEDLEPADFIPGHAREYFEKLLAASSLLCVFQLQDLFLFKPGHDEKPADERINVPGTWDDVNWSYRIPYTVRDLEQDKAFCETLKTLATPRRARPIPAKDRKLME